MAPQELCQQVSGLLFLLALAFSWQVQISMGALIIPEQRLNTYLTSMAADSFYVGAGDLGVFHTNFTYTVPNPIYPYAPPDLNVRLHLFLKYMHYQNMVRLKGFVMADTRDITKMGTAEFTLEPVIIMRTVGQVPRSLYSFSVRCLLHSYWDPPAQAAMVYGFEANFTVGPGATHEYDMMLDKAPEPKSFKPLRQLNLADGRGAEIPPFSPLANRPEDRDTFVVLKPLYNFNAAIFGPLIERHVDYYQNLGVSKHILYLRRENLPALLLSSVKVAKMAQMGKLLLVLWDELPEHEIWHRKYDQRVVYSHALLATTGMNVNLLYIDLDEYLVTTKPELQKKSIQEIITTCAGDAAEVRMLRYHTVCKACPRDQPEAFIWLDFRNPNHPLSWYHLTNYQEVPAGRSIVNPNLLRNYYIHWGSVISGHNVSQPPAKCMFLLHVNNMVRVAAGAEAVQAMYVEDHSWMGMLKRLGPKQPTPPPSAGQAPTWWMLKAMLAQQPQPPPLAAQPQQPQAQG